MKFAAGIIVTSQRWSKILVPAVLLVIAMWKELRHVVPGNRGNGNPSTRIGKGGVAENC